MHQKIRTYEELSKLTTFDERFMYLRLADQFVGEDTFGHLRYLNQKFYRSKEWRDLRNYLIVRDLGCDLGVRGYDLGERIIIHHMNPIRPADITHYNADIWDPNYLICVSLDTHNAIHYGSVPKAMQPVYVERTPNDTCPWKR